MGFICLFRDQGAPSRGVSHGKIFRHLRHERGLPVHGGGDANLPERAGYSVGQHDVHGLSDGRSIHCLLGKCVKDHDSIRFDSIKILQSVISEKAPFLIIALLCVIGAVPGLFLPETADLKMPDTLEDMKEFGR